jgi:hypothetical protein
LTLLLAIVACNGEPARENVSVRDSAGVQIVQSPAARGAVVWADASTERLVLGEADGNPATTFDRIRAVTRLADGSLVVADGGSREIRLFSASGSFQRTFGGSGEGPGEFRRLGGLFVDGSLIIAHDPSARRLSAFTPQGQLRWERSLPRELAGMELVGGLGEGTYLFSSPAAVLPAPPDGIHRLPCTHISFDAHSGRTDTLATVPGFEFYVADGAGYEIPFARDAFRTVGEGLWFTGTNDQFAIQVRGTDGRVIRRLEYPTGEVALTRSLVDSVETATVDALGEISQGRREAIHGLFRDVPWPGIRPTFGKLVADRENRLWVADWRSSFAPPTERPRTWWVFSSTGPLLGTVSLPETFDLHDAGTDWLLGVEVDGMGVQRVAVRDLRIGVS